VCLLSTTRLCEQLPLSPGGFTTFNIVRRRFSNARNRRARIAIKRLRCGT
jgi:hypothetical protein